MPFGPGTFSVTRCHEAGSSPFAPCPAGAVGRPRPLLAIVAILDVGVNVPPFARSVPDRFPRYDDPAKSPKFLALGRWAKSLGQPVSLAD